MSHPRDSALARAIGRDFKGWLSIAIYLAAVLVSFAAPMVAFLMYWVVAIIWLIPDRRIERALNETH